MHALWCTAAMHCMVWRVSRTRVGQRGGSARIHTGFWSALQAPPSPLPPKPACTYATSQVLLWLASYSMVPHCTAPQAEQALGTLIIAINLGLVLYYLAIMLANVLRPAAEKLQGLRAHISTTLSTFFSLHVPAISGRGSLARPSKRLSSIFGRKGPSVSAAPAASGSTLQSPNTPCARASVTSLASPGGTQARSSAKAASLMQSGDGAAGAHDSPGKSGAAASPGAEAGTEDEDMAMDGGRGASNPIRIAHMPL